MIQFRQEQIITKRKKNYIHPTIFHLQPYPNFLQSPSITWTHGNTSTAQPGGPQTSLDAQAHAPEHVKNAEKCTYVHHQFIILQLIDSSHRPKDFLQTALWSLQATTNIASSGYVVTISSFWEFFFDIIFISFKNTSKMKLRDWDSSGD